MGRFLNVWLALHPRQRLIAGLALLAVVAAIVGLVQATRHPPMETLYAGLQPRAAEEVGAAIQGMGIAVEIRGNTVMVPAGDRERVRMALAAAGLPRNGPEGYELLDGLDGFGTTSEMFAATYWRAKEGELARTVLAVPGVRSARVHIANPAGRPFQRTVRPTASVTVTMGSGVLDTGQAEAIRFLVSSAVAGLDAEQVSVIDSVHGAILRAGEASGGRGTQRPGSTREAQLRAEIERLLAARVGDGKAIVTVAVETTAETETTVERLIDPSSRVAISTDTREIEEQGTSGAGATTVASNLPLDGGGGGAAGSRSRTESEERINYEVSQTTRERIREAGEIRRITVAVLVDGVVAPGPGGQRVWTPRPDSEIAQLRDLVRSAVGYDEGRGDVVTVETLEFAERPDTGTTASAGIPQFLMRNALPMTQIAALVAVALGLALFVLRPLLRAAEAQAALMPERLAPVIDVDDTDDYGGGPAFETDPLTLLRNAFADQRADSASVLRSWLERDVQNRLAEEQEETS